MTRHRRVPVAIVLALASACSLAGCSISLGSGAAADPTPRDAGATSPAPGPTDASTRPSDAASSDVPDDTPAPTPAQDPSGGTDSVLPPRFPLPDGASVTGGASEADQLAATVTVTDGPAAYAFWRRALGAAGYTVTSSDSAFGIGEIRYRGHGCGGDSQIAVTGTTAAVQCDLE